MLHSFGQLMNLSKQGNIMGAVSRYIALGRNNYINSLANVAGCGFIGIVSNPPVQKILIDLFLEQRGDFTKLFLNRLLLQEALPALFQCLDSLRQSRFHILKAEWFQEILTNSQIHGLPGIVKFRIPGEENDFHVREALFDDSGQC